VRCPGSGERGRERDREEGWIEWHERMGEKEREKMERWGQDEASTHTHTHTHIWC